MSIIDTEYVVGSEKNNVISAGFLVGEHLEEDKMSGTDSVYKFLQFSRAMICQSYCSYILTPPNALVMTVFWRLFLVDLEKIGIVFGLYTFF